MDAYRIRYGPGIPDIIIEGATLRETDTSFKILDSSSKTVALMSKANVASVTNYGLEKRRQQKK